ncbi:30S ribosomal protein S13 [Candidatus Hodgkinia cicadicola]|uniref:30S ribosomal protein S13 n=1 Tax=Candidatus Hodgkinia cicadicola TaxID=573658 RepID=A0ABX4MH95_9HYPH|nr:30S ribosomal protein S13 [Candidatus Hodgkinia cicadicola]
MQTLYGIGPSLSYFILSLLSIDPNVLVWRLSNFKDMMIVRFVENNFSLENILSYKQQSNIASLKRINCYRGSRHRANLLVRGQRTRTNAHNRKYARL